MDEATQDAFGVVYSAHKPNDVTDDDIFGSNAPKRIGDSWPINDMAAIKSFAETGLIISEGHLSGTTSVIGKDKVGSADCLSLRGELKADGLSSKDFPSGVKVDEGKMRAVFRGCFPIERAGLSHSGGGDFSLSVRLLTPDGTRLQVTSIQKTDEIWNALEK